MLARTATVALALLAASTACAQDAAEDGAVEAALAAAQAHRAAYETEILAELRALLALPNVASDTGDIRANADLLVEMLERRGAEAQILETPGAPVSVYGALNAPGAERTLLFYAHFDGQPVDPQAWATPPFEPVLRAGSLDDGAAIVAWEDAEAPIDPDWRVYARSASDDKSPIVALLAALDALQAADIPLSANIRFFFEGEEEAGSSHLAETLETYRALLDADVWVFCDGPMDPRGLNRAVLGVRGVTSAELTVYGPASPVHSGHYGNVAPNPAARLARLIASMRGENGEILIEAAVGDLEISETAIAMAREAFDDQAMLTGPAIAEVEAGRGLTYGEALLRPTLDVLQLRYGPPGEATNTIHTEASAVLSFRLTPGLTRARLRDAVGAHLEAQGYRLVTEAPTREERARDPRLARIAWSQAGYESAQSDIDDPGVRRVIEVTRAAAGGDLAVIPLLGGSLPIAPIRDVLGAQFLIVPMVNADNNQHAPNENLRLGNLWDGIALYAALYAAAGTGWSEGAP